MSRIAATPRAPPPPPQSPSPTSFLGCHSHSQSLWILLQDLPRRRDRAQLPLAPFTMATTSHTTTPLPLPLPLFGSSTSCTGVDTRVLSTYRSSPPPSSSSGSPIRVDAAMNWSAPSSSSSSLPPSPATGIGQDSPTLRHLPFSILLNPNHDEDNAMANMSDGEDAHEAHEEQRFMVLSPSSVTSSDLENTENAMAALTTTSSSTTTTASTTDEVAPQPKRRGRKPHLPKMNNSERGKYYRNKRKHYGDTLTDEVELLREQIARLSAVREICCDLSLSTRMSLPGSLTKLVREYFVQFRHGVQLPPSRRNMTLADVEISTTQQDLFMNAVMEHDVDFGEYRGIATVMDQWRRYSQWHSLLSFELISIEISGTESAPMIATKGQLRTRYSRKTIENVFPHIIGNEPLIQRLVGKEIVYPCQNLFYFSEKGHVQRYDVEANFAEAMVNALGNTDDAVLLLDQALIQQQHMMGVLDDELVSGKNSSSWVEYVSTGGNRDTTNRGKA